MNEHEAKKGEKGRVQADDVRVGSVMDGKGLLSAYVLVHIRAYSHAFSGMAGIDGQEASIAGSAVEVLKASGPQGRAVS